eukprot:133066-Amphidinium_carterae.1
MSMDSCVELLKAVVIHVLRRLYCPFAGHISGSDTDSICKKGYMSLTLLLRTAIVFMALMERLRATSEFYRSSPSTYGVGRALQR